MGILVLVFILAAGPVLAHFGNGENTGASDDDDGYDSSYYKAGNPTGEEGADDDSDDSDDDDHDGGGSGYVPPPPDVPSAAELVHLSGRYIDADGQYEQALGRYATLTAGADAGLSSRAGAAIDAMRRAETRARTHLRRMERTAATRAAETTAARETALERAFAATGVTAGDPVSVATGTFITSETDFAFRHGGLAVAARRTYRSGAWPTGGFGLWSWPFDTRIIRGVTPGAEETLRQAQLTLAEVQSQVRAARGAIVEVFGVAALTQSDRLETRLSDEAAAWGRLDTKAEGAHAAAAGAEALATALAAQHADWNSPVRYRELADDARSLRASVERWLSRAQATLAHARAGQRLLDTLAAVESSAASAVEETRRAAVLSREASEANRFALRPADPPFIERTGAGALTLIDERGVPHVYRTTGSTGDTRSLDAATSTDELSIRRDGGYLRRLSDGRRYHYSRWGLLERIEDRNGNAVELDYDGEGRVIAVRDDSGRHIALRWRGRRITELTDPLGHTTRYAYDELGRLARVTDAVGVSRAYEYTGTRLTRIAKPDGSFRRYRYEPIAGRWRVSSTVDEEGHAEYFRYELADGTTVHENPSGILTRYHYDERGRASRIILGDAGEVRNDHDGHGNLVAHTDARGFTWRYEYDDAGNRTAVTDPTGNRREWVYDRFGGAVLYRDALGHVTRVRRDDRGNPTEIRYPDGSGRFLTFTDRGRLQTVVDRNGGTTTYGYDSHGYVSRITHPDGSVEGFEHDRMGRLTRYTDETGVGEIFEYRGDGLLASKTRVPRGGEQSDGHHIVYEYNERKDRIARTGPRGFRTTYRYDRRHNLIAVENPLGEVTRYRYREDGRLVERSVAGISTIRVEYDRRGRPSARLQVETGARTELDYDESGRLILRRGPAGGVTRRRYSPSGRLRARTDPAGGRISYDYDAAANLVSVTDARGGRWELGHDELGRRRQVRGPEGFRREIGYDDAQRRITVTDALAHATVLAYDERWRLIARTDPAGETERWGYDAAGRVTSHTDRTGAEHRFAYDEFGRLIGATDPEGGTRRVVYDAGGNRIAATDPLGHTTSFEYDGADRLVAMTDPGGFETRFVVDALGNRTETHYPDGTMIRRRFDGGGNLIARIDETGHETTWRYDEAGRLVSRTDPLGSRRQWSRDAAGRLLSLTTAGGATTRYEYGAGGNLIAMTDPAGETYRWEYNRLGLLAGEVNRRGRRRELEYDAAGRLVESRGFDGRVTRYERDALGRLSQVRFPDGEISTFSYDPEGRLLRAANDVAELTFAYDRAGRMRSSADARAGTRLEYRYDAAGNRVALRVEPGGLDITSEYDERGNLSSVTDALGGTTVVTYDERGRERSRSFPNGVERQTSYTVDGLVSGIVYRNARRGVIAGEAYVYDEAGRRRLRADAQGRVAVYEYDSDGRLTRVAYPTRDSGSPTFTSLTRGQMHDLLAALTTAMPERKSLLSAVQPARVQTFRYDARGNRSRMTEGSVAVEYDYDVDGRLRASGATRYQHDTRGNLIAVEGPERTVDLAYGSRNRVTRAEVRMRGAARPEQGEAVIEFGYDPLGRRVRREDIGEAASPSVRGAGAGRTVTRYVHDQLSVTPVAIVRVASGPARELTGPKPGAPDPGRYHRLDGRRASTGGAVAVESLLVWLDGELLAKRGPVHDDMGYCGVDERGSRIVTFDQTGGVRDRISYDAFGNTSDPGAMYSGKLRDPDTGLYDYGYRDYDSATGRFTTVDPVKDGTNWYSFLGSDPVNRRDPNGLFITVGPGLGYDHRSDRYRTTDARSIRDKSRIHITRNSDSDDFYNDTMQLKVDELVLTDAAVQSEADTPGKEHQTVPTGRYEGYLLDYSGSYDDPILLENESKGVPAGHGYLIHPNEYTNPTRIAEVLSQGRHIGPWNQPFSEGCQITRGREAAVKIRTEIGRLGFRTSPHSHFRESAGVIKDPDSIAVQIKNR